ncbi:MAG: IS110 family transposase [Candidatus Cloacimonetes bacterium]|jgi:transposase|nr:IS110 family transposase [Candidatus Cloacimonadota bacterium]
MSNKTQQNGNYEVVNKKCAGIDVHRDFVSVTVIIETVKKGIFTDYREFETNKKSLLEMRDWLVDYKCTVAGLESTGKYWYPVYFSLEDVMQVNVYNARNMRNIPGKKTDKKDSEWIAKITRHALIMPSYIPEQHIRDARLISRERKALVQQRGSVRQRALGILDSAGIKLSSVMSDVFGVSGRNLLDLLINRKAITVKKIEGLVYGQLRKKSDSLMLAMDGYLRDTHIFLLKMLLDQENDLTKKINAIEERLEEFLIDSEEKKAVVDTIITIPGFSERSAMLLLSEVGFDLETFPSNKNFCSWVGLAPGKKESAGKNVSGKIQVRQRYLRALLIEVALASTRCKGSYVKAKYWNLKGRIGGNKAVVAIAHYLARAAYRAIKEGMPYKELTENHASLRQSKIDLKQLTKITQRLGKEAVMAYIDCDIIDENDQNNDNQ